jgi:hypothetical protein
MSLDHGSFFRRYGPAIAGPFRYRRRNFAVGEVDVLSTQLREFPSDAAPQQPNITNARAMAASGQSRSFDGVCSMSELPPKADFPILELIPSPALRERRHRGLARRLVAVGWRATLMRPEGQRPHPRRCYGGVHLQDAADNGAVRQHVVIVVVPLAGWAAYRCALEDQGQGPSSSSNQSGGFPR